MGQRVYLKEYDFNLAAGGIAIVLAEGAYFRVQSSTGAVSIIIDGLGELPGLLAGQGIKSTPFRRLTLRDVSGAANVGKLLVSNEEFIDNRTYGVNSLDAATIAALKLSTPRPELPGVVFSQSTSHLAGEVVVILAPGANANGAIVHSIEYAGYAAATELCTFLSKASAPASQADGNVLLPVYSDNLFGTVYVSRGRLTQPTRIPAGQGLYFFTLNAINNFSTKSVRYTLL